MKRIARRLYMFYYREELCRVADYVEKKPENLSECGKILGALDTLDILDLLS